jgi:predicted nucleotidyltransferase
MFGVMVEDGWVDLIAAWASRQHEVAQVALYGSRITGYSHHTGGACGPDSDLDIAVKVVGTFDPFGVERCSAYGNWAFCHEGWQVELQDALPIKVDVRPIWPADGATGPAVAAHGVEIYRRQ